MRRDWSLSWGRATGEHAGQTGLQRLTTQALPFTPGRINSSLPADAMAEATAALPDASYSRGDENGKVEHP